MGKEFTSSLILICFLLGGFVHCSEAQGTINVIIMRVTVMCSYTCAFYSPHRDHDKQIITIIINDRDNNNYL